MPNENKNKNFFNSFDRVIILCYCLLSFILNIIIFISIFLVKNKKISIIMRIASSILAINFLNIFSYTFQWVLYKDEIIIKDNSYFDIGLLVGHIYACNIQSFILLSSSLSQDFLIIVLFFFVSKTETIKVLYINIFFALSILIPILISIIYLCLGAFGINEDFCYIKKFIYEEQNEKPYKYQLYNNYIIYCIIIYSIRGINFSLSIFLLIKIILYIKKEKSFLYIINKLSMLFIQLFKLFIILLYRILDLCLSNNNEVLTKLYIILSTIDGLLIPLAFSFSNEIYSNYCIKAKTRNCTETDKDFEEDRIPNMSLLPNDDEDITKINTKASGIYTSIFNSNNFDLSYDEN